MGLMTEIQAAIPSPTRRTKLQIVLDALEPQDREELLQAMRDAEIPTTAIVTALKNRGLHISETGMRRYRKQLRAAA